jgi:DNA helicase-2/ATP-dependent DNA helicase PcrA
MQRTAYASGGASSGFGGGYSGGYGNRGGSSGGGSAAGSSGGKRLGAVPREEAAPGIKLGARVRHAKFGEGVVLSYEGRGSHARVQVNFKQAGSKWLVVQYANLEAI